jgi:hypothetical protein
VYRWHGASVVLGQPRQFLPDGTPVAGDNNLVTQWRDLQFDIEQGTLHAGVDVQNIHGGGVFSGSYDPQRRDGTPLMCRGFLNLDSLTWNNFQFTDIRGPVWLDDRQIRLGSAAEKPDVARAPQHISAKFYGGVALADATVNLTDTPWYSLKAAIDNVSTGAASRRSCSVAIRPRTCSGRFRPSEASRAGTD